MNYETGEFGAGGGELAIAQMRFRGKLGAPFGRFVVQRARRLSLDGWMLEAEDVTVLVQGPAVLIDMFEMACSLGPIDAMVDVWERLDVALRLEEPPGAIPL